MFEFSVALFFVTVLLYIGIMRHDPRTMWSGFAFWGMMVSFAFFSFAMIIKYENLIKANTWLFSILFCILVIAVIGALIFPTLLIGVFFIEGIKVIRKEGLKVTNLLSLIFAVLLCAYLAIWPQVGTWMKNTLGMMIYEIVSFSVVYSFALMSAYVFSAIFNLIHLRKNRNADYIVILGAGIIGTNVTPLLAARIEKGMELLNANPDALLIMSGGQGPGEDIPEGEAMASYAIEKGIVAEKIIKETKSVSTQENLRFSRQLMEKENPRIIVVTTAYHVFRALLHARQQGMKCVGYGSKTKWYFTLNALLREFAAYLQMTWKKHACVISAVAVIQIVINATIFIYGS